MFKLNNPDQGYWNGDRTYSATAAAVPLHEEVTPIMPEPGASVISPDALFSLPDGHYEEILVEGVSDAAGCVLLKGVTVSEGFITGVSGGEIRYTGELSDLIGHVFAVDSGGSDRDGLRLSVAFNIPDILP
jgi:hypothetical protein